MAKKKIAEPILGVKNIRVMKNMDSKLKAFCDVIIPTPFGNMQVRNFKVVDGQKGLFVSIPSRPAKAREGVEPVYYNDILFESKDKYTAFKNELERTVLQAVKNRIERAEAPVIES